MQIEDFWKALHDKAGYETPPNVHRNLYGRLLSGRLDSFYYVDVTLVVASANLSVRRGQFDRTTWARHGLRMLDAVERAGGRASFTGFDNIALATPPVVYTSNHMSVVDTTILPASLLGFGDVSTVVKESLLTYPLFGRVMRAVDPISVSRRDPREDLKQVLTKGEAFLRAGRSVLIFPQATRGPGFNPSEFNSLGVKLARNAGVQVVPIALKTDFQGIGKRFRDFGPLNREKLMHIKVGTPLTVEGNGRATHEAVVSFITDTVRSWGAEIRGQRSEIRSQSSEVGKEPT